MVAIPLTESYSNVEMDRALPVLVARASKVRRVIDAPEIAEDETLSSLLLVMPVTRYRLS